MKYLSVNTIARLHAPAVSAASDNGYWIYDLSLVYVALANKQTLKDLFLQTFSKVKRILHESTSVILAVVNEDINKGKTNYFSHMMTFLFVGCL